MIISRMEGGLGNQMFQYAYGLYLARRHSTELILDTRSYQTGPQHGFLLDNFRINAAISGKDHATYIPVRYRASAECRSSFKSWFSRPRPLRRHKESPFGFHPQHLNVPNNRYLVGYWQSEDFFPGVRPELLSHFRLKRPLSVASQRVAERINTTNSLCLHVRRGDYVTDQQASSLYHQISSDHYRRCADAWANRHIGAEAFVFSNDMSWCRRHLQLPLKTHWIDHNDCTSAHEDLVLMSLAAGCAIANSTFSWWAAWLNERPEKVVYAPPRWFTEGTLDEYRILPAAWVSPTENMSKGQPADKVANRQVA